MSLSIVTTDPLNAEASLSATAARPTPVAEFYIRDNFPIPALDAAQWRLRIGGRVRRPLALTLAELMAMPATTRRVTLECAGNGRRLLEPPVAGTPWGLGAAGTADFTGVPLHLVLQRAAPADDVIEIVFTGADGGDVDGRAGITFQRSLPVAVARGDGPLLAWAMNDQPLTPEHGYPLRIVVPCWYAVASVKWLVGMEAVATPFTGHFQSERYVYRGDGGAVRPVTLMRVRSLITSHSDGDHVPAGPLVLEGVAWSGSAPIRTVEVQVGPRAAWRTAIIDAAEPAGVATRWSCTLSLSPGTHTLRVRAFDEAGHDQPETASWNELGYGINPYHAIALHVPG